MSTGLFYIPGGFLARFLRPSRVVTLISQAFGMLTSLQKAGPFCAASATNLRVIPGSQVNQWNHGDRFRGTLRIGLWDPFQMAELHGL